MRQIGRERGENKRNGAMKSGAEERQDSETEGGERVTHVQRFRERRDE